MCILSMKSVHMKMLSQEQPVNCLSQMYATDLSCELFTPLEFLAFEYLDDIWFQQFDGPANKFSAILGQFHSKNYLTIARPGFIDWQNGYVQIPRTRFIFRLDMMYIYPSLFGLILGNCSPGPYSAWRIPGISV